MNILINSFPEYVDVGSKKIRIHTDFRSWLSLILTIEDEAKSNVEKLNKISSMILDEVILNQSIIDALIDFMNCGEQDKSSNTTGSFSNRKILSYEQDQYIIYADFIRYYQIDLSSAKLHWWQFKQLLTELPDESQIKKVMFYRSVEVNSKMPKEQQKFYREMKKRYALEQPKRNNSLSVGAVLMNGIRRE